MEITGISTEFVSVSYTHLDVYKRQAQACKNSGGKVIVQVEKIVQGGTLDPKLVAIPGIYVDSVVVGTDEENMQCLGMPYDGALTGEFRIPVDAIPPIPLDAKKILARRAAMELSLIHILLRCGAFLLSFCTGTLGCFLVKFLVICVEVVA